MSDGQAWRAAIAERNARRKSGDPARADIIALLTYIDGLEAELREHRARHQRSLTISSLLMLGEMQERGR